MSRLILASGSAARAALLRQAGLEPELKPVAVDEEEVRLSCRAEGMDASDTAEALAWMKARRAGRNAPDALVIGADQMLEVEGEWLDKPGDPVRLREQLLRLRGRTHTLHSAAVVTHGEERVWHTVTRARLTMRAFSDSFLDAYVASEGGEVCGSVGGYHLEGAGVRLFDGIEGDYFTILGLPLLPLLGFLRQRGVMES